MPHFLTRLLPASALALLTAVWLVMLPTTGLAQGEYRAQAGDTLVIEVIDDPSLNRSVQVLPDGRFSFPFAGSLQGAGRTTRQLQNSVTAAIAENFASRPTVFVSIQPLAPGLRAQLEEDDTIAIYVLGEVANPGLRDVDPGTTFLQAMAQAGALTRFAATKRIQLRRTDPKSGRNTVQTFNLKAISEGALLSVDPRLREGDVILVPERRLFE